jgi:hypothetical protein
MNSSIRETELSEIEMDQVVGGFASWEDAHDGWEIPDTEVGGSDAGVSPATAEAAPSAAAGG